jgi:hypothetical protein
VRSVSRCLEFDTHSIVLALLYKLKKTTSTHLQIAVYLAMKRLGWNCIDYSEFQ